MNHPALRLTPSHSQSPFSRNTTPRSPTKINRAEELGLRLSKVIGTTTTSANGFDYLPLGRTFAYTAGAAAVVATVHEDLTVTQRFFKARPTSSGARRDAFGPRPVSPTPSDARSRTFGHVKEHSVGGSPLGASGRDWSDAPAGRSTSAKDRIKAATSVALSPNGKWLAVGESGYKPRVLIFALAEDASDVLVTVIAEHTFGVHALSFSPDSSYLASLGVVNDGFLYVWNIDNRTGSASLYASNKCTVLVNDMEWIGRSVVTAGLRFVKVWRVDENVPCDAPRVDSSLSPLTPRHRADNRSSEFGNSILAPKQKVLAGKNSLLGDLLDANLVKVLPLSETEALLCAETGEICLLEDIDRTQLLTTLEIADFNVSAARIDGDGNVCLSGKDGQTTSFSINALRNSPREHPKQNRRRTSYRSRPLSVSDSTIVAMCTLEQIAVEIDGRGNIRLTNESRNDVGANGAIANQLPGHDGPIAGVHRFSYESRPDAACFTYSANGVVQFWGRSGEPVLRLCAPVETAPGMYDIANELKAAAPFANGTCLAVGDRYGTLTALDIETGNTLAQVRAHSAEIADLCAFTRDGIELLATAGRDRMVQLLVWKRDQLDLLQTMDEHAGAVTGLLASSDGNTLLSCSADRTVVIRDAMLRDSSDPLTLAYVIRRTLTLKSAPTSFCFTREPGGLLVSSTDRAISSFNTITGQAGFSFRCGDSEGGDAAIMTKIIHVPSLNGNPTVVGISSTDKSVRLYSEVGTLLARDWGHTEGITDVALLPPSSEDDSGLHSATRVVSVAADSTIFLWDTTSLGGSTKQPVDTNGSLDMLKQATPIGPPLRKVLSYSELSRFRRDKSIDEGQSMPSGVPSTTTQAPSPQRLRHKPSRTSVAQAPRLEPAFRTSLTSSIRRRSLRQRSPSPPSPRNTVRKEHLTRPALALPLRSKSSENVLGGGAIGNASVPTPPRSGFGSVTSSTESLCRTLRAYRKRLAGATITSDSVAPEALRELEKELKITARVLSERSQGRSIDEAVMARLLDQASEKIVGMLDERIKERVEGEARKSAEGSPASGHGRGSSAGRGAEGMGPDVLAGALERVALEE